MSDATKDAKRLQALLDIATDALLEASDHEVLEELRNTGGDPAALAQEARAAFAAAQRVRGQRRLQAAREGLAHKRQASTGAGLRQLIPRDPEARRRLLDRILSREDLPRTMTLAFREGGGEMADEEVLTALEDFADLGILDEDEGRQ